VPAKANELDSMAAMDASMDLARQDWFQRASSPRSWSARTWLLVLGLTVAMFAVALWAMPRAPAAAAAAAKAREDAAAVDAAKRASAIKEAALHHVRILKTEQAAEAVLASGQPDRGAAASGQPDGASGNPAILLLSAPWCTACWVALQQADEAAAAPAAPPSVAWFGLDTWEALPDALMERFDVAIVPTVLGRAADGRVLRFEGRPTADELAAFARSLLRQ
jgi:hypothetical protein